MELLITRRTRENGVRRVVAIASAPDWKTAQNAVREYQRRYDNAVIKIAWRTPHNLPRAENFVRLNEAQDLFSADG